MKRCAALLLLTASAALAEDPQPTDFSDLLQRPPFSATRRPVAGAMQLSSASLRLTGLVTEQGRTIALIRSDDRKGETRIVAGAGLNGWTVVAIDAKGLALAAAGQHVHVVLKQAIPTPPQ